MVDDSSEGRIWDDLIDRQDDEKIQDTVGCESWWLEKGARTRRRRRGRGERDNKRFVDVVVRVVIVFFLAQDLDGTGMVDTCYRHHQVGGTDILDLWIFGICCRLVVVSSSSVSESAIISGITAAAAAGDHAASSSPLLNYKHQNDTTTTMSTSSDPQQQQQQLM